MKLKLIFTCLLIFGFSLNAQHVQNITQNTFYSTISEAVINANSDDSILVSSGIYAESISINTPLTLLASDETFLDAMMTP